MIANYAIPNWKHNLFYLIVPRLRVLHGDMTNMVAFLRDVTIDIWTESPSDQDVLTAGRDHYSLAGWRAFYKREINSLQSYNTANGTNVSNYDAGAKAAIDGYLASAAPLNQAFNNCLNNYKDGSGNVIQVRVSQADRNTLATAIEGQLA